MLPIFRNTSDSELSGGYNALLAAPHRFSFNGMEKDDEMKGIGNSLDFGARIYDSRLGRWMSVDPLANEYPGVTTYGFSLDNPIYFVDPDGRSVKPSTAEARSQIQNQLNTFNQNPTLNQIFGGVTYGSLGKYNDPNGGNPQQGEEVNGFSLSGITYNQASNILNKDMTGLTPNQKLEALSWLRALSALDVAEIAVYNTSQTSGAAPTPPLVTRGNSITDNSFVTSNPSMTPFMNAMGNANGFNPLGNILAIPSLLINSNGVNGVPFLPNVSPGQGLAVPNIVSPTNQNLNIVGLYPVAGTSTTGTEDVMKAIVNFGVKQGGVSVSDQNNTYRMNQDGTITTKPK